jgi:hypothetical protein
MLDLKSFSNLEFGREIAILPSIESVARTEFRLFPTSSPGITPFKTNQITLKTSRFSCFLFDQVQLVGFRLLKSEETYFTDESLVSEASQSDAFWRKITGGLPEDLAIGPHGIPNSLNNRVFPENIEDCLILASDEPSNFGSWIYRILPKLILSRQHGIENTAFVYHRSRWMLPILQLADDGITAIHHETRNSYNLVRPIIPSLPSSSVYMRPEIRAAYLDIGRKLTSTLPALERVYLSRRKQAITRPGFRVLENETALVERLSLLGFVEFFPEDHSIADQISVVSNAQVIICSGGSGLFNCLFARAARLIIDIEANSNWSHAHMNLLSSTGIPFSMVAGIQNELGTGSHRNWTIDIDCFLDGLTRLLQN